MKIRAIVAVLLLSFGAAPMRGAQPRFVTTRGREFVAPGGRTLALKGINLGNWLVPEGYMFKFKAANSPRLIQTVVNQLVGEDESRRFWQTYRDNYITDEDIKFIRQSGFNSVRVPFSYRLFVTEGEPRRLEGVGYELLDRVVGWCRREGLYVILDMHGAPGGQTGDNIDDSWGYPFLFESPESQELTVSIWRKLAARYRHEPTVLGYDLLNEPIPHFFDTGYFNPKLEPLYRKIVAGIRQVDRNHIIFLGGAQWDTNFKVFGPPFDDKLAYTFHKYWMTPFRNTLTSATVTTCRSGWASRARTRTRGSLPSGRCSNATGSAGASGPTRKWMLPPASPRSGNRRSGTRSSRSPITRARRSRK
jgi:endoglucanase